MPQRPDLTYLTDIAQRTGNDRLQALHEVRDQLRQEATDWCKRTDVIAEREPRWRQLQTLLAHATDLPVADAVRTEVAAIEQHRRLLDHPDPVPGCVDTLTQALRGALNQVYTRYKHLHEDGRSTLAAAPTWQQLTPEQQHTLTAQYRLEDLPRIAVGSSEEVLETLQTTRLREWENLCDAWPTRCRQALAAAAQLLEPQAQHLKLPSGMIRNDNDLQAWLSTAEQHIRARLKDGPVLL